ncbi:SLAP domain-containing protein [Parageobacillus sp. G301]|uniref:SLAP domain-containing protein n=1 Tax=Parageobacillus sp. G301 TaxID=2998290 RepID=UPI00249900BD|nr:SLAP domain-containing protein [Parageobacillus sp. G301]GLH64205.1 hypothetical protein PG301_20440 [Parageobacillus sp. G301]
MKKVSRLGAILFFVAIFMFGTHGYDAKAAVRWEKLELKKGMIGKITVVNDTELYRWTAPDKLTVIGKLKKGQEYRVYSSKTIKGSVFYGVGGGTYVKKTANIRYTPLSKEQFISLVKQALKGHYVIVDDGQYIPFVIEKQKGNRLFGWYLYNGEGSLPIEGELSGNVVTLRVYFEDDYTHILDSISYLQEYKVPKEEIEEIAEQLVNNDDYYMQFQFTIADSPTEFSGQFRFVDLYLDDRYDVVSTELGEPFAIQVKKLD